MSRSATVELSPRSLCSAPQSDGNWGLRVGACNARVAPYRLRGGKVFLVGCFCKVFCSPLGTQGHVEA